MNILEIGIEKGREEGLRALIETCKELGLSKKETSVRLVAKCGLSEGAAEEYLEKYWK